MHQRKLGKSPGAWGHCAPSLLLTSPQPQRVKTQCGFTLGCSLLIHSVVSAWGCTIWPWEKQSNLNLTRPAPPQDGGQGPPTYLRLLWQPKGSPHHAEGRGLESEVWEVALDHSDCLCRGFLPHLRSGLLAAQTGRCPAGEWSGCRRMLPRGRTGKRASREVPLQIQPIIPGGFGGPCGMWSTEIEIASLSPNP